MKTIVFLTSKWTNVDDNIRKGKAPGGVPSISRAWTVFNEHGWNVHVFVLAQTDPGWPDETVELSGVTFHWIKPPLPKLTKWLADKYLIGWLKIFSFMWQMKMIKRLRKAKLKPDIVYCMRSTFALLGLIWARLRGAKCVLRWYGTFLYDTWFVKKNWLMRIKLLPPLLLFKLPFDMLIMTNDGTQGDKIAQWMKFDPDRFWFPINGVNKSLKIDGYDAAAFKESIGVSKESPMLLTLGRLTYWKRLDRIINAMKTILKEFPNTKLVIVGSGELREKLGSLCQELGVEDSVQFMGSITHDEIKYYLNAADIFVMPNDVTNMCSTLIESLIAGCCVVTRDVGSTTEVVSDDDNAIVLSPGEADEFAKAIVELLRDPNKRERLASSAHSQALKKFVTWEERMEEEFTRISHLVQK